MKNYLIIMLLGVFCTISCKCTQKTSPYFVSSNAHSLIDSYRDLATKAPNTGLSHYVNGSYQAIRRCVGSAMPNKGYRDGTAAGYATYTSFHFFDISDTTNPTKTYKSSTAAFRTAWHTQDQILFLFGNRPGDFVPNPIFLPNNNADNVFQALLVPVADFQSLGLTTTDVTNNAIDETTGPLLPLALNSPDIKTINDIFVEAEGGYMSGKFPAKYANTHSSVGLVCEVVLKTGEIKNCYIFNNEDLVGSVTLTWKVKKK